MTTRLASALAALALALAAGAAPARALAQRDTLPRPPAPRDTTPRLPQRRDSAQVAIPGEAVRADTLPGAKGDTTKVDTTAAAPSFPVHPLPPAHGFSDGSWTFGPAELQYFHGLSLADLLDRIPGLVLTRSGGFGRPLGVSPFAAGGGRFRIYLDGYELRPMGASIPDLQRIPMVNLQSVRIQRGLEEIRVDITSLHLADARPLALIEGMDGDLGTRALRGLFTRPIGRRFLAEVALDVDQSEGARRRQKFRETSTITRLGYAFSPTWGLQAEYRVSKLVSENTLTTAESVVEENSDRSEAILRGRGLLAGRVNLEAMVGRSLLAPAANDSTTERVSSLQADVRVTMPLRIGMLAAGARLHRGQEESWAPDQREVWGRLDFTPGRLLAASAEVRQLSLGGVNGVEATGSLRAGPWKGVSLFGQVAGGSRGIRFLLDTTEVLKAVTGIGGGAARTLDTVTVRELRTLGGTLNALRGGAELDRGRFHLGAALLHHRVEQTVPYGVLFDVGAPLQPGLDVTGVEAYGSLPLYWRELTLEGWYQRWLKVPDRVYLPAQLGRAAIQFRGLYKSGNLEPTIRLEMVGRDQALAWDSTTSANVVIPRYAVFNWFVQVRIIDIRIFWRFENAFVERGEYDVPSGIIPGPRALYGVRWFFRN
ncbi:MAG TPA: Plug domain-containing protein [Longimicrobium sp.]|nr:Plug domain-containing protein [Longimicrobium sp.]